MPFSEGAPKTPQKLGLGVKDLHGNETLQQVSVVFIRAGFPEVRSVLWSLTSCPSRVLTLDTRWRC